ncbi:SAV0927 family protein [Alkalihalobacillus sp. BA299]|uniref:SAV0927 family protein n=1 Tax=Alkalihalobacillus sp. BA299 TaxID=2815938 RepID=UPI001AD9A2A0|nr:SAV0927 family protein [Alkalihalobacillus sp. BA299]
MKLDILQDEIEQQNARFICFLSDTHRYDFWIFYSHKFYGKSMVYSLHSGKLLLLCPSELEDLNNWQVSLGVVDDDVESIFELLKQVLESSKVLKPQY